MRWPFRRKGSTPGPGPVTPSPATPQSGEPAGGTGNRPTRHWASLPPLPVTIERTAPLVMGPAPVLPALPGPRPLSAPPLVPPAGRVEGLAQLVPPAPEPPAPAQPEVVAEPVPGPLVHRKARPLSTTPSAPLTEAVGDSVGEPREPAEPYRAPAWLRYMPSWAEQGGPGLDLGLGLGLPSSPPPARPTPPTEPRQVTPPPKILEGHPPASGPDTDARVVPPVAPAQLGRRRRRPSLGESRRLGLGAPLTHAPGTPSAEEDSSPQDEPPPAVVVLPEPADPTPGQSIDAGRVEPEPSSPRHRPPTDRPDPAPSELTGPPPAPVSTVPRPVTPSPTTRPPASSVSLVYRSAPVTPDRAEPRRRGVAPVTRPAIDRVPPALASAIHSRHGVDVADVPVHRGPEVAVEAHSLGARAFTRGGEVFLPSDAGPLDSPKARGLLAHELVHAVQQRTLGPSLPALSTSVGAALEADAVAAEHEHSGHAPVSPLVHPALPSVISQAARSVGVQLAPLVPQSTSLVSEAPPPPPPAPTPSFPDTTTLSEPVRQEVDQIAEANAIRVLEQWTNPDLGGTGFSSGPVPLPSSDTPPAGFPTSTGPITGPSGPAADEEMANQILQVVNMDRASKGQPALSTLDESTMEQVRLAVAEQTEAANRRAAIFGTGTAMASTMDPQGSVTGRPADVAAGAAPSQPTGGGDQDTDILLMSAPRPETVDDQESALRDGQVDIERIDLEELSTRLYDRLRSRLRLELLVDRERAGLLTDFR